MEYEVSIAIAIISSPSTGIPSLCKYVYEHTSCNAPDCSLVAIKIRIVVDLL